VVAALGDGLGKRQRGQQLLGGRLHERAAIALPGLGSSDQVDRDRPHLAGDLADGDVGILGRGGGRSSGGLQREAEHVTAAPGLVELRRQLPGGQPEVTAVGTGALIVVAATLGAPKFEPWYLLPALPFFGLSCTQAWRRWLTTAVALSVLPTFANILPAASPIVPVWGVVTTGANVAWFVALFRSRYLGSLGA